MKRIIISGIFLAVLMCVFSACGKESEDSVSGGSTTERVIIGVTDPGGIVARVVEAGDGECKAEVIWQDTIFSEGDIIEVSYDTIYYVESYEDNTNDYPEEETISIGDVIEVTYFDYDLETMKINVSYIEHWNERMLEDYRY